MSRELIDASQQLTEEATGLEYPIVHHISTADFIKNPEIIQSYVRAALDGTTTGVFDIVISKPYAGTKFTEL
jgi:hypothetical protein